jgi:serine/threonine-protein kinase
MPEPEISGKIPVDDVEEPSPLSLRLRESLRPETPPPALSTSEKERRAATRVDATLKGWRLMRLLGTGPVTAAYEAARGNKDAKERAVVKLMIDTVAKSERAKGIFIRASYAANRFTHARVLPILEDGVDGEGAAYVVRPWVDAEPLEDAVAQGPLDEVKVLRVAEQVLDALEMAHAHGILHGALTPRNILVTPRGSVRLCDFAVPPGGLARGGTSQDEMLAERRIGPFAAPERCDVPPTPATEQADIYSLAACLFFAVSGKYPRGTATDGPTLARTDAQKTRDVAPQISEGLGAVIDHALSSNPLRRYESAYAMLGDVRRVMAGRRPKLGEAMGPVPSQSLNELPFVSGGPASSRRIPTSTSGRHEGFKSNPPSVAPRESRQRDEWRGNVLLILAIALLVGVATFVLVREKIEEESNDHNGAPASLPENTK